MNGILRQRLVLLSKTGKPSGELFSNRFKSYTRGEKNSGVGYREAF